MRQPAAPHAMRAHAARMRPHARPCARTSCSVCGDAFSGASASTSATARLRQLVLVPWSLYTSGLTEMMWHV